MAPRPNVTAEKKAKFIEEFKKRGSIFHAAPAAGCSRRQVQRWRETDPAFALAMHDANYEAADALEDSLYERGMKSDTTAAIFWLKGNRPEKYRERVDNTHRGDPQAPIQFIRMTTTQRRDGTDGE